MTWSVRQPSSHGTVVVHQGRLQAGYGVAFPARLITAVANGKTLLKDIYRGQWLDAHVHRKDSCLLESLRSLLSKTFLLLIFCPLPPPSKYSPFSSFHGIWFVNSSSSSSVLSTLPRPAREAAAVQVSERSTVRSDTSPTSQKPFLETQRGWTWGKI